MKEFKIGDFIRLKNNSLYQINRVSGGEINIFEISNISSNHIEIQDCDKRIPYSEIEAIPINGIDDLKIYYDPIIATSSFGDGEPKPIRKVDKSYYLETFQNHIYQNKNLKELVKEQNLKYVHDVQNFLRNKFQKNELRIDVI